MGARYLLIALLVCGCSIDVSLVGKRCSPELTCPDGLICQAATGTCREAASGTPLPDWTDSMLAVYRFEPGDLVADATTDARSLSARNGPEPSNDAIEGTGSALIGVDRSAGFDSSDPAFAFDADFTFGGWFIVRSDLPSPNVLTRTTMNDGYTLEPDRDRNASTCRMDAAGNNGGAAGPDGSWPLDTWVHVACAFRRSGADASISAYLDGEAGEDGSAPWGLAPEGTSMSIAPESNAYDGQIDELFFADSALSQQAVARIRACGVDGQRCLCGDVDPTQYAECGGDCSTLPPCNQQAP